MNIVTRLLEEQIYYKDIKAGDKVFPICKGKLYNELTSGKEYNVISITNCKELYGSALKCLTCVSGFYCIKITGDKGYSIATCHYRFKNNKGIEYKL